MFAVIAAFVNTVAKAHMTPTDIFSGSYPDYVMVRRVSGQTADGINFLVVKNRFPGCA